MPAGIDLKDVHLKFRVREANRLSLKEYLVRGLFRSSTNPVQVARVLERAKCKA